MMLQGIGAGSVFLVCAICMLIYIKLKPPGVAFTYCWLFYSFLAVLTRSPDALGLAFCIAFGINISWYMSQVVDSLLWKNMIPYWEDFLPHCLIRFGDVLLHPIPFILLLPYHNIVDFRILSYAFLLERWYFILVEGHPFGTGSVTNIIYDFRPHLPQPTVSRLNHKYTRIFFQILICLIIIYVCLSHTDRLNSNTLPDFSQRIVGQALDNPVELYTTQINEIHEVLQKRFYSSIDGVIEEKFNNMKTQILTCKFSTELFWDALPKSFKLSEEGIITSNGYLVLWVKLADIYISLLEKLKANLPSMSSFTTIEILSIPSLEYLNGFIPNIEIIDVAIVRQLIEAMTLALTPVAEKLSIVIPSIKNETSKFAKTIEFCEEKN